MAEKNLPAPSSGSSPAHNGMISVVSKCSTSSHQNGSLEPRLERQSPRKSRTPASTSPLRTLRALRGFRTPATSSGSEEGSSSSRPRGQSFGSALSSRTRSITTKDKIKSSHQAEPEALLDLILESQGQRLDDQRASLSLLPDSEPATLCGACSPDQNSVPSLDFYYMLIHYQSDRMEDQRSSLPHLDDVMGLVPGGQEDFFSLIQRVQSRRMDEQRASLMLRSSQEDRDLEPAGSPTTPSSSPSLTKTDQFGGGSPC